MIEGNDEAARKKLCNQWSHVNQQIAQTELNIYNLLQHMDDQLGDTIKTQQEEVLRQQQVLVDQRASMDRQWAIAIGVSLVKKKARSFYPGHTFTSIGKGSDPQRFSRANFEAVVAMREKIKDLPTNSSLMPDSSN